jgi:hypothetical protein
MIRSAKATPCRSRRPFCSYMPYSARIGSICVYPSTLALVILSFQHDLPSPSAWRYDATRSKASQTLRHAASRRTSTLFARFHHACCTRIRIDWNQRLGTSICKAAGGRSRRGARTLALCGRSELHSSSRPGLNVLTHFILPAL